MASVVLLVEDEEFIRKLLADAFGLQGHDVRLAEDVDHKAGAVAVAHLRVVGRAVAGTLLVAEAGQAPGPRAAP